MALRFASELISQQMKLVADTGVGDAHRRPLWAPGTQCTGTDPAGARADRQHDVACEAATSGLMPHSMILGHQFRGSQQLWRLTYPSLDREHCLAVYVR